MSVYLRNVRHVSSRRRCSRVDPVIRVVALVIITLVIIVPATLIFGNAALVVITILLLSERREVREILEAAQLS